MAEPRRGIPDQVRWRASGAVPRVRRFLSQPHVARRAARVVVRVLRGVLRPARPVPRVDPVPPLEPLPRARYLVLIGAVPLRFGGRTASILNKCRLFKELGGIDSTIVTLNHTRALHQITTDLRRRGLLVDGVDIVNLYDYLRGGSAPSPDVVPHEVDEPGMDRIREGRGQVYGYFENGVYRLRRRYDAAGRLVVQDWFDESRTRTRSDEFAEDGTLRRMSYLDLQHGLPRQQVFFRADGSPYLNKLLVPDPGTGTSRVVSVTLLDRQGLPTKVLRDDVELAHDFLGRLAGDEPTFLAVESRRADTEALGFQRPNVKQISVVHNVHTRPPRNDPALVRPTYQPMFERRDELAAIVFLTGAQRADAEAHFGRRDDFRVIPHPMRPAPRVPFEERDPNLVVMLARLHPQKQLLHAIKAFARVVKAVPGARLEIHGEGSERALLQGRIDALGLSEAITLPGYTRDPAAVYRRAALSLLTSSHEAFPLVLLETLSHGCPVVSYDVKYGPSEIVLDGVNGFLVPSRDHAALAQRVIAVLTDPVLRRRLTDQAAAPRAELSEQAFVARWSKLFRDLDAQGWG